MAVAAFIFPLFDAFLTILWIFLFVLWIWLVISVTIDVFASHDLSGVAKALWFLVILFFPLLGVVMYLLLRGQHMAQRRSQRVAAAERAYQEWFDRVSHASHGSVADELEKLAGLRDRGVITEDEFNQQKLRLVGASTPPPPA